MAKMRKEKVLGYEVIIKLDESGWFYGTVPELPGCLSQGKTIEKFLKNIKEAIELYLEHTTPEAEMTEEERKEHEKAKKDFKEGRFVEFRKIRKLR